MKDETCQEMLVANSGGCQVM